MVARLCTIDNFKPIYLSFTGFYDVFIQNYKKTGNNIVNVRSVYCTSYGAGDMVKNGFFGVVVEPYLGFEKNSEGPI